MSTTIFVAFLLLSKKDGMFLLTRKNGKLLTQKVIYLK
ncbi:hypothetical protein B4168_2643 [Anoxybacillus flavithermus]|nr:hypothetical protein B4168_2643 [Anoxybacillus flavithermus]OAO87407.1 hypothetical protein GT23_1056 [Parageobacillus thermoglucosidasius]